MTPRRRKHAFRELRKLIADKKDSEKLIILATELERRLKLQEASPASENPSEAA